MRKLRYAIGAVAFGVLLWQGLVWITGAANFILPSPSPSPWRVAQAGWDHRQLIWESAQVTATEVALGLVPGTFMGVVTAILLASSRRLHQVAMPLLVFTQAVPVFALAPILTLWF